MCARHIIFYLALAALAVSGVVYAQVDSEDVEARQRELEEELDQIEAEIDEQEKILAEKQRESVSLERDIAIFDAQIERARLSIEQRDLVIRKLSGQIGNKAETIHELTDKIGRQQESLAALLRRTNEIDNTSLVELALGNQTLSSFLEDLDAFESVQSALKQSFEEVRVTRSTTEVEKVTLENTRAEELELLGIQQLEKQDLERKEDEKAHLLSISRGREAVYQEIIAGKQLTAAQIRAELFQLRGSTAIPFGEALEHANFASSKTGVRPAFILGVIAQESALGENVGNCNLPDDPPQYKWDQIMKPERDIAPYLDIVERLGFKPDSMPLSCPPGYGWGGAMGPAQFIPSTWVLYETRIASLTSHNPPNPWDARDAFTASGLLLKDNGADRGTRDAEWLAAQRYFAGWANAENPAYAFYGNSVMSLADGYQRQIDILERS